jgi:hypothetical protein
MAVELARVGVHGEDAVIVCEQRESRVSWLAQDVTAAVHHASPLSGLH